VFLNGVPIKLTGACHHETDPLTGRANTMHHAEEDVKLAKAANLNYLRTSHYPPCMELVEAADKYGITWKWRRPSAGSADGQSGTLEGSFDATSAMVDLLPLAPQRDLVVAGQRVGV